ncbi:MAG: prenyltransferase [Opitutales bacterium]
MATLGDWIQAARPRTLVAAAVPVAVAAAVCGRHGSLSGDAHVILGFCLVFALFAQIASNLANDLGDGLRGTDQAGRVGPSRAVANGRISARAMGWATAVCVTLAFLAGAPLALFDPWLLVAGILALLLALGYTLGPAPLAYLGLGDIFVVACFGVQATFLTGYVLHLAALAPAPCSCCEPWVDVAAASRWPALVRDLLIAGLGIGLLADNILLANNARDRETDALAGKRTTVVRFGCGFARGLHACNLLVGLGCLAWVFGWLPLLLAPLGIWSHLRFRQAREAADFVPFLGQAALILLLAGVLCVTSACLLGGASAG